MDNNTATFLDLDERIKDNEIIVKTFDKREAFNFEIVNYPDLSGNIPKNKPTEFSHRSWYDTPGSAANPKTSLTEWNY